MSDRLADIYDEHVLDHFEAPYHKGRLEHPSCEHSDRNPICGDQITVQLELDAGKVKSAWFDGKGCAISQAAASMLCEHIEGKSLVDLAKMPAKEMLDLLQVPLTASRQKCGLLAWKVAKTMAYLQSHPEDAGAGAGS